MGLVMPPKKSDARRLTDAEVKILRDWIDAGPSWPDAMAGEKTGTNTHWSLKPLVKPALLSTNGNPIDSFIREACE